MLEGTSEVQVNGERQAPPEPDFTIVSMAGYFPLENITTFS